MSSGGRGRSFKSSHPDQNPKIDRRTVNAIVPDFKTYRDEAVYNALESSDEVSRLFPEGHDLHALGRPVSFPVNETVQYSSFRCFQVRHMSGNS